jgi:alditol oxidase
MAPITTAELNWSGTYTYAARQIHRPRTIGELQRLVQAAKSTGVFGVHFTWLPEAVAVNALVDRIDAALQQYQPRPHRAKVFGEPHSWSELYPRLADFRRIVEAYDPRGIFWTPFLARTVLA